MAKTSKKTKETKKKKKVEKKEAKAPGAPKVPEESKEPEKAAEEELTEEEILEEPEEEEIEAEETKEAKAAKKAKKEAEEEIVEERIYTIPLDKAWISPRKNRTPKAVRMIQSFIQRHMKPEVLLISNEVNERIWSRGIRKPPRRIRVRAAKDAEGTVTLYLAEGD